MLAVLIALASAGGIGGGEVIVPVVLIFFGFSLSKGVPLSQFCIFIGAATRFILQYRNKHPYRDAVQIDYTVSMILLPGIVFGASIG